MHGSASLNPTIASLSARAEFRIGATRVRPAVRELSGPGGVVSVEPRVLQVLLVLADARGGVVTRDELVRRCWNGQFVGDDALNRTIAQIRKAARDIDPDGFGVETIAKTGYRLTGTIDHGSVVTPPPAAIAPAAPDAAPGISRRWLIGGGVAGLAALGGVALWRQQPSADERRATALVERGTQALRDSLPDRDQQGLGFLREAVALDPDNAAAWGKLALAERGIAEYAAPAETAAAVRGCETAARRALALDPRQADALAALALLQPIFGDWYAAERRLRAVLAIDPGNLAALGALSLNLVSTGRVQSGAAVNLDAARIEPLSPIFQYRRVYHLWATGRSGEADRVADRAMLLWPRHPAVWFARLWTLAFTGRAPASLAMVDDREARPPLPETMLVPLRTTLRALGAGEAAQTGAAVAGNLELARLGPGAAVSATLMLSGLGAVDAAFAVANGYLLRAGALVMPLRHTSAETSLNDQRHRKTMMLWMPVTAPLRADPRFLPMCAAMGMTDYWRRSGTRPDFLGSAPLPV